MKYEHIYEEIRKFPGAAAIGRTEMERDILCFSIGGGRARAVFAAAFHGLEYLTGEALLNFAKKYRHLHKYHDRIGVYFIPLMNPDGVDIAINGMDPTEPMHRELIKHTGIIDFTHTWQANAAGVDINHNFDALWQRTEKAPAPSKYGGAYPHSERETQALTKLLRIIQPELFIAFHSQGKEIYYDFNGLESKESERTAKKLARKCGYTIGRPTGTAAYGGAKDWYIQEYHKQAFTVELGDGKNPLPYSQLRKMSRDVNKICITAIKEILKSSR